MERNMTDIYLSKLPRAARRRAKSWRAKQFELTLQDVRQAASEKEKKNWKVRKTL